MSVDVAKMEQARQAGQGALAQISAAVVNQIQDSQQQQADALVQMINDSQSIARKGLKADGLGDNVDISV